MLSYIDSLAKTHTHTHTHTDRQTDTHPFNGPLSRITQVSRYQKKKPIWILLKQETVSGSSFSWAICMSAPRSAQTTMCVCVFCLELPNANTGLDAER